MYASNWHTKRVKGIRKKKKRKKIHHDIFTSSSVALHTTQDEDRHRVEWMKRRASTVSGRETRLSEMAAGSNDNDLMMKPP